MIRSFFVVTADILITLFIGSLAILLFIISPTGRHVNICARIWGRMLCFVSGVEVTVEGEENFDRIQPCIYTSNHNSHFDLPALMSVIPGNYRVIAKRSLFYLPIFGWLLWLVGFISIDRSSRSSAFRSIKKAAKKISEGMSLLVFPEGTRNRSEKKLLSFRKGPFLIAMEGEIPVLPITVTGTKDILPPDSMSINPGEITIRVGEPVHTEEKDFSDRHELSEAVRERMIGQLDEIKED